VCAAVGRFRLRVVDGGAGATSWESSGDVCSVGSAAGNDLQITDETVSGQATARSARFPDFVSVNAFGTRRHALKETRWSSSDSGHRRSFGVRFVPSCRALREGTRVARQMIKGGFTDG
jgi:hypothetical protein